MSDKNWPTEPIPWDTKWELAVSELFRHPIGRNGAIRLTKLAANACRMNDARELKEFYRSALGIIASGSELSK